MWQPQPEPDLTPQPRTGKEVKWHEIIGRFAWVFAFGGLWFWLAGYVSGTGIHGGLVGVAISLLCWRVAGRLKRRALAKGEVNRAKVWK